MTTPMRLLPVRCSVMKGVYVDIQRGDS